MQNTIWFSYFKTFVFLILNCERKLNQMRKKNTRSSRTKKASTFTGSIHGLGVELYTISYNRSYISLSGSPGINEYLVRDTASETEIVQLFFLAYLLFLDRFFYSYCRLLCNHTALYSALVIQLFGPLRVFLL